MLSNYCFELYTFKWETPVWFLLFLFPRKHFTMNLFLSILILQYCHDVWGEGRKVRIQIVKEACGKRIGKEIQEMTAEKNFGRRTEVCMEGFS